MVYYGRVRGVYRSSEDVGPHVIGYGKNLHKKYMTREEAEQDYSDFLAE
jgi:viroplasmin and RNaseH domain-containing protein